MRRAALLFPLVFLLLLVPLPVSATELPPYHVKPLNGIFYPRIGYPALLVDGSTLRVVLERAQVKEVYLESIFVGRFKQEVIDQSQGKLGEFDVTELEVKVKAPPGLYNLTVITDRGSLTEPNSVAVFQDYPKELKVIHWTDTHYGVRDLPKHMTNALLFRSAIATFNVLKPDLVIHTGDVIDAIVKKDEEEPFKEAYEDLVSLRVPIIMVQGNNDNTAIEKGAYYWEKYFGPLFGEVAFGPYGFFLVDSDTGRIVMSQFNYMGGKFDMGVGLTHYPFDDKDIRMWEVNEQGKFVKALSYNETLDKFLQFSSEWGVKLWLTGHWHSDGEWEYSGVKVVLTDAGQYDHGTSYGGGKEDYGHYRLVTLRSDGTLSYESTSSLRQFNVTFLRRLSWTAPSVAFYVAGTKERVINVTVVLSEFVESPEVEGATLVDSKEAGGKGIYTLKVEVPKGRKLVVIQAKPDKEPPTLRVKEIMSGGKVMLFYRAEDRGTGVKEVKFYFSKDNKTWAPAKPELETGWPTWKVDPDQEVYYKVEVIDAAGNKVVKYFHHVPETTTSTTVTAVSTSTPLTLVIIPVIVIVILLVAFLLIRRK